ncbi:nucleoside deaminase [Ornithinibacillus sp. L9]|uniref:Nucleoside deaminase n=1 Tax=Ornithinibacillus caprae TaxID=2678566 RepID=A0A6N8FKB4_9BACI|nr:nucleoside deaminase [Ornithinibacillus caprae]MUK89813.1 nucleoside deaminase [Ornithinibacillus caprae]
MIKDFDSINHETFMGEALIEAKKAGKRGDRPIGSVIVHNDEIIARGANSIETSNSNVAHAEIETINQNTAYLRKHARECIIYSTVEPCVMCLSTIVMANIRNVVFAVEDKYMNMKPFIASNPYIEKRVHNYVGGILADESLRILKKYSPEAAEVVLHGQKV